MAFNYVKLNEEKLPRSLGVKGKSQDGIRYYTIDGVNMPSVTSILGQIPEKQVGIQAWRNAVGEEMANYISTSAINRGKATHTLIENHLKNEDDKSAGITAVTPLGVFRIMKPYLARLDNIHCIEEYLYSNVAAFRSTVISLLIKTSLCRHFPACGRRTDFYCSHLQVVTIHSFNNFFGSW